MLTPTGPLGVPETGTSTATATLGLVVIGRNEGPLLRRGLMSVIDNREQAIYVDSDSQDGSAELAESLGFAVVRLDPSRPLSAARARNEGFAALVRRLPGLEAVQFIDGDCELVPGWAASGLDELRRDPQVAIVCGHIRERSPQSSPYNRMMALEWGTMPVGDIEACGGNMMVRTESFQLVGGFRDDVPVAEDNELCLRIRQQGWRVRLLDADMVSHDSDLNSFGQWWRRAMRTGWGYAQGWAMHGRGDEQHFQRQLLSDTTWGGVLPVVAVAAAKPTRGLSLGLLAGWGALGWRIRSAKLNEGWAPGDATLYAALTTLSKPAGTIGAARYATSRLASVRRRSSSSAKKARFH